MISNSVFLSCPCRFLTVTLVAMLGIGLSFSASGQSAVPKAPPRGISATGAPAFGAAPASVPLGDPASLASPNWAKMAGAKKSDGSVHQGITVHGHWVIDVKNPDGTLAQHRDFENSLESGGQGFLVGLMSGYLVPGDYMLVIGASGGASACNATYQYCGIVHNLSTYPALGYCSVYYCTGSTLNYTYNFGTSFGGPFSMVLSGAITANQTGTIGSVYSLISTCANIGVGSANPSTIETNSPSYCVTQTSPEPWSGPLTQATITPVAVTSGQIIQVTVTFTFS
jgi:hypothetical protein